MSAKEGWGDSIIAVVLAFFLWPLWVIVKCAGEILEAKDRQASASHDAKEAK